MSLRVVVDELSELAVDGVVLDGDVDSDSLLELDDVVLQCLNFDFGILELSQELEGCLVGAVDLVLEFKDIVRGSLKLLLELELLSIDLSELLESASKLVLNIFLLGDDFLKSDDGRVEFKNGALLAYSLIVRYDLGNDNMIWLQK